MTMTRVHLPVDGIRPAFEAAQDARDQVQPLPERPRLRAPEGAPNVLVVLIDDMGFGAPSAFGGPCPMPTAEALASDGLKFSRFHTTALCSPTRQSLLTGRNHHSVGMGTVLEVARNVPGYDGDRPRSAGTLAQVLGYNGYATGAFGKWHQTPPWEQTPAGPFDRWPTREGFDKFYGILSGMSSQFTPTIVDGTTFVGTPPDAGEDYHFSEDLVDQTQAWIRDVRTFDPDKPWFTYLSFGATHSPFHLPESWRGQHRGEFAHGWDEQRERTLARQKELGLVPEDAELAPWSGDAPHWDEITDTERLVAERLMETYAAFAEHTDAQVGRLVEFLRKTGELDNTIVVYILGDNGAAAEGGIVGTLTGLHSENGMEESAEFIASRIDEMGGPMSHPNYPVGWALAMDTPYQWAKQVASHYGGTRNGLIVSWPDGIRAKGEVRHQWHHVVDVVPTLLEVIGLPHPETIDGIAQRPFDGTSFAYAFDAPDAADRHSTQYFEILGNRGIYHEGWTAVARHSSPWQVDPVETGFDDDVWELYDTNTDWTQARDVAADHPRKLAELQELFIQEARRNNVFPMDGWELDSTLSGRRRPHLVKEIVLGPRSGWLREDVVPSMKNTSFRIRVDLEAQTDSSDGVLVAQGGRYAGWTLFVRDGVVCFGYNFVDRIYTHVSAEDVLRAGPHTVDVIFTYDGGGVGRGGDVRLVVDGAEAGSGRLERTVPIMFSADETLNVGIDRGTPVSPEYSRDRGNPYIGGSITTVTITSGADTVEPSQEQTMSAALGAQ